MRGEYTAEGVAVPDSLEELHRLLEDVAGDHPEVSAEDVSMMETAVIEIAGNLIEHGRPAGSVRYRFTLTVLPDRLEGRLSDSGQELPRSLSVATAPDDDMSEDGRGLFLARAVLDELVYVRTPEANTWSMTRRRH